MRSTEEAGHRRPRVALLLWLLLLPGWNPATAQVPDKAAETAPQSKSDGAPVPAAVATITGYTSSKRKLLGPDQRVIITRVDHKKVRGTGLFSYKSNTETLSPGRHTIGVQLQVSALSANGRLWLDAEPGKAYIVRKRVEGYGVRFWIEEVDTGRVVGGMDSSSDPDEQ
ncbi:MAG: hypothetical protein ACJ8R9_26125 [Steroidobacteraceae bacterium]